jgi:hypothetical protein
MRMPSTMSHKRQNEPLPEHSFQGNFVYCRFRSSFSHQLVRVEVTVQGADALAVVVPADGLGKKTAYIENDELLDVLGCSSRNRVRVCDDDLIDLFAVLEFLQGVATEQTVRGHAVDLGSTTTFHDSLSSGDPGTSLVDHVIDDDHRLVAHIADESDGRLDLRIVESFLFLFLFVSSITSAAQSIRATTGRGHGHEALGHGFRQLLLTRVAVSIQVGRHGSDARRWSIVVDQVTVDQTASDDIAGPLLWISLLPGMLK